MPSKRRVIKEILKIIEFNELKDFKDKKVKIKLPCGGRFDLVMDYKEEKKTLKLIKSG